MERELHMSPSLGASGSSLMKEQGYAFRAYTCKGMLQLDIKYKQLLLENYCLVSLLLLNPLEIAVHIFNYLFISSLFLLNLSCGQVCGRVFMRGVRL